METQNGLILQMDGALPPGHTYIWTDLWTNAAGVYFMALTVFGVTFPLVYYARPPDYNANAVSTFFYTYVYLGSSIVLAYMHISLRRYRKFQENRFIKTLKGHMSYRGLSVESLKVFYTALGRTADDIEEINLESGQTQVVPPFEESEEGVHILLRVGAIVFTLAAFIEDGLQLAGFVEPESSAVQCYGAGSIVIIICRIFFIFSITFFIFKYHKVVIQTKVAVMKFCLSHLVASALVLWSTTVIKEALEIYMESLHIEHIPQQTVWLSTDVTVTQGLSSSQTTNLPAHEVSTHSLSTFACLSPKTVGASAAPYLYPFVIELSLVVAAVLHHIFKNTCHPDDRTNHVIRNDDDSYFEITRGYECHKSTCGLFLGLCVFAANCVFVALFVMEVETHEKSMDVLVQFTVRVYFGCHSALNILGILAVILVFYQTRKLGLVESVDKILDKNLLLISLGGYYFLLAFEAVAGFDSVNGPKSRKAALHLAASLLGYVQATLQVIFTLMGLNMRASSPVHVICKPGRTTVAFLVLINFAMWVTNTFQMKALAESVVLNGFYGELAWVLIFNVFLPLSIFFRFHSSICLVEIWTMAYQMKEEKMSEDDTVITEATSSTWQQDETNDDVATSVHAPHFSNTITTYL